MPFVKGKSGNPGGRGIEKVWREAVLKAVRERVDGSAPQELELIARSLVTAAKGGDVSAIREIGDRLDGKAVQQISGDGDDGALIVKIIRLAAESGDGK